MTMAVRAVEERGGTISSQYPGGGFSVPTPAGAIDGNFKILGKGLINVTVSRKPEAVLCSDIRDQLVNYLTEAVKIYAQLSQVRQKGRRTDG